MIAVNSSSVRFGLALALAAAAAAPSRAHFPWLATDDQGRAVLFFGESPLVRDYRLPEAVENARVLQLGADGKARETALARVEEEGFNGRRGPKPAERNAALGAEISYGIYHGMLLDYYAKGLVNVEPEHWADSAQSDALKLNATPRVTEKGLELAVRWAGKPLAGAQATLTDAEGNSTEAETDAQGVARFDAPPAGLVGFLVNRTDPKATGDVDGQKYTSAGQYATVTIMYQKPAGAPDGSPAPSNAGLAPLPEPVSSFGGAVCDGWLYVYGGHTGEEHDHSKDNLSTHFRRLKLDGGAAWEELPMQTPLQGMPLVAHGGKLYRVGGLSARNAHGEEEDLHSVAEFACYDPAAGAWTALPPLPEPRSSHDAVVLGDVLYVAGGWKLEGDRRGDWLGTAWAFDLADPAGAWRPVPTPPFKRRALALAAWHGNVVALGGMDDEDHVSQRVDVLELDSGKWSTLPEFPAGGRMRAFGASAWTLGGTLYASGPEGVVFRLGADGEMWEAAGKLETPRFFHRLLPLDETSLMAVAGASFSDGHLANIEVVPATRVE